MTINNILNMSLLKELDMIALTDHNSCKNCPALMAAAQGSGLTVLPGMELSTAEEIHVVCLFPTLENAMGFDDFVSERLPAIDNVPKIFGDQWVLDAEDEVVASEKKLLVNATSIPIDKVPDLVKGYGGLCFPAHIDRSSYSVLSNLGFIPPECGFRGVEVAYPEQFFADGNNSAIKAWYTILTNSDAHDLGAISEREHCLPLGSADFKGLAELLL